jgi:ketosteroid isomerase-like protein
MDRQSDASPTGVITRIQRAVNAHDLDALAACFELDYRSEQPLHPNRAFRGREQMRKNWSQIFGAVPNIQAEVLRCAVDGNTVWTEWDMRGTRGDGAPHRIAMVTIGGVRDGEIAWMRLYMEQVSDGEGIDTAVREGLTGTGGGR